MLFYHLYLIICTILPVVKGTDCLTCWTEVTESQPNAEAMKLFTCEHGAQFHFHCTNTWLYKADRTKTRDHKSDCPYCNAPLKVNKPKPLCLLCCGEISLKSTDSDAKQRSAVNLGVFKCDHGVHFHSKCIQDAINSRKMVNCQLCDEKFEPLPAHLRPKPKKITQPFPPRRRTLTPTNAPTPAPTTNLQRLRRIRQRIRARFRRSQNS